MYHIMGSFLLLLSHMYIHFRAREQGQNINMAQLSHFETSAL